MEGVGSEAASLAGHLKLDNLCWSTTTTTSRSKATRGSRSPRMSPPAFWVTTGTSCASVTPTISSASATRSRYFRKRGPADIDHSRYAHRYGSPHRQDTAAAHGEPLGLEECKLTKRAYGWPEDAQFLVPDGVREHFAAGIGARGAAARRAWNALFDKYRAKYPSLATEVEHMQKRTLPDGWDRNLPTFPPDAKGVAGRDASGQVLNVLAQNIPWFMGGSGDLGPSNKTTLKSTAPAT